MAVGAHDDEVILFVLGNAGDDIAGIMYTESRSGRPEFVLVDGIGEKLLIPIRAMSAWISGRYVRKVQRRILAQVAQFQASRIENKK